MKTLICVLMISVVFLPNSVSYCAEVEEDKKPSSGNEALTGALMGGLLGAGVGAAIGSASGKAGTGAAIGAGVGAVGGTLLGAEQAKREEALEEEKEDFEVEPDLPKRSQIKKRIIREYDDEGNVISEKEIR